MSFEDIDYKNIGEEYGYDETITHDMFEKWQSAVGDKVLEDPEGHFAEFLVKECEGGETVESIMSKTTPSSSSQPSSSKHLTKRKVKFVKKSHGSMSAPKLVANKILEAQFDDPINMGDPVVEATQKEEEEEALFSDAKEAEFGWGDAESDIRSDEQVETQSIYKSAVPNGQVLAFKENAAAQNIAAALRSYGLDDEGDEREYDDDYGEKDDYVTSYDSQSSSKKYDLENMRKKYGLNSSSKISFFSDRKSTSDTRTSSQSTILESLDDIVAEIENSEEEYHPENHAAYVAQKKLKDMLISEAMRINDKITSKKLVLALIPELSVCEKTLQSASRSRPEKAKFVMSNLVTMTGNQPEEQLYDRPYSAIDGTGYIRPSTGPRRLVGERNTIHLESDDDEEITNKHYKSIRPVYIADS